jgi:hypothetical protein
MNRCRERRMAWPRLAAVALLVPFVCGCATFHVYPEEDRNVSVPDERISAIVTNPELSREAAILAYSGIYDLDHTGTQPVRITLRPLEVRKASGKFFAFALFLGLLPATHADTYEMSFWVEDASGNTRNRSYVLHVAERWWLFNFLSRSRNQEQRLGEALRAEILN